MKAETKYKGSVRFSAIGDALGWVTEFEKSPNSIHAKFGVERVEQFVDWKKNVGGRFYGFVDHIKAGSYSDDTQLMLAVARSIRKGGSVDHEYFSKVELPNWLHYARGGGRTVKIAAEKIARKSATWYSNFFTFKVSGETYDYKRSGANGAAMRVLPIALANLGNIEKIKEETFCNSIITHGHPRAILGAILYGFAINQILVYRPENFGWENFLTQLGQDLPSKLSLNYKARPEISDWLKEWNRNGAQQFEDLYDDTLLECQSQLRVVFQSIKQNLSVRETLTKIGCFDPATKGSGIATVAAGIYLAARFNGKPQIAIVEAVNSLGSDTDSIAAFAGGLLGALHGHNAIPEKWRSVQDLDYLDIVSEKLLAISEDSSEADLIYPKSDFRSVNELPDDNLAIDQEVDFSPLGPGKIQFIDRQNTPTKGKYNLLLGINLRSGQSILVSKLFDEKPGSRQRHDENRLSELLAVADNTLKPKSLKEFKSFFQKEKHISEDLLKILLRILKNNE
ncbi:MAG: ADP-ribosylglycohydrolase family protein [Pedobacter sp.]|nr:MAG: ADP-ribosylglycohydrolase family protein [Pedobacter sp.]